MDYRSKVRALFTVTFLMGFLASVGLPTELASPDDLAIYSSKALLYWIKGTIFGKLPGLGSITDILLQIISILDLVFFLLLLGTIGYISEVVYENLKLGPFVSIAIVLLSLILLFVAGTLLRFPSLIPLSLFLAFIPFLFFERIVCQKCK